MQLSASATVCLSSGAGGAIAKRVGVAATMMLTAACDGQPAKTPDDKVELGEPSDDIDPAIIGDAVRESSRFFQRCYESGRELNPELAGRVELRFLINTDGSIGKVVVVDTDLPLQIADCVVNAFYGLTLPQQESAVVAQYPMFFQPS
jgi:hypothetical protein